MLRRKLRWLVALGLGAALAGHWFYWYAPRERPGTRHPEDLPARLLDDPRASFSLWIAYPHQNLAAAAEAAGDLDAVVAALSRRAGRKNATSIPGFGPFLAPPAREVGAAWSRDGEVAIAARVYPTLAFLGRLAGKVASNPWLAGGAVELGGRPATVEWDGTLWIARTAGAILPGPQGTPEPEPAPTLAAFRVGPDTPPLPAGRYPVRRSDSGALEAVREGAPAPPGLEPSALEKAETALLVVRGAARPEWTEPFESPGALALFPRPSSLGLPGSAVFARPDLPLWKLPSRGIEALLSGDPVEAEAAGLRLAAPEETSLASARDLAPAVAPWLAHGENEDLVIGLWLDPRAARKTLGGASDLLTDLPFLGHRREAEALADWRTVLAPLEDFSRLSLVVLENPDRARLALERH